MNVSIKMLVLSAVLAITSLAIPFSETNMVWVNDASYSFLIQVALPHLGIAVSSIIGGYAGALFLSSSKDQTLNQFAGINGIIATAMLICGVYVSEPIYVFIYSLVCPPLIGIGVLQLSEYLPLRKRGVTFTLIFLLLLLSIALLCIGITSRDWIMIIDFGTSFRVLFGALMGGLAANLTQQWKLNTPPKNPISQA
ncbi:MULTISPECIES: hypothetical protein [Dickeya]|uniref:DUF998 domain-containing protein n=1 Tax=Dickeya lacustris TaxID=2259638 RepID=A0ABY8G5H4_9GAMM|nr:MULTISPECIES: hypothetical protein [Dickeya]WFN55192.1 hypothetical protein O1Q98_16450 [Dickeya lacustris]WJM85445.1 hypothetical protein QUF31_20670 [Dickeya chrysanthemi]